MIRRFVCDSDILWYSAWDLIKTVYRYTWPFTPFINHHIINKHTQREREQIEKEEKNAEISWFMVYYFCSHPPPHRRLIYIFRWIQKHWSLVMVRTLIVTLPGYANLMHSWKTCVLDLRGNIASGVICVFALC